MIIKEYKELEGMKIFDENICENHTDYNSKSLDILFAQEEKHFWFLCRKEFILQHIKNYISKENRIMEIGAGTGNVSRFLQKNGYKNISVGEMHLNGLRYAKNYGIEECYKFNLLDSPFENEFDSILMFDVLEHIQDDDLALQNINKSLKKNGNLILTVPSHMWLWNRDDTIAGHKIRYTKTNLIKKLENNGFKIINARYFFMSITPLLYLRRILNKDTKSNVKNEEYEYNMSINPIISKILYFICRIENKINKFLPNLFGGSLFIIVRKHDSL